MDRVEKIAYERPAIERVTPVSALLGAAVIVSPGGGGDGDN